MATPVAVLRKRDTPAVDLTPMLDVVFILLIFFVVTASFLKESALPLTGQSAQQPDTVESSGTLMFHIDSGNRIFLNNRLVEASAVRAWIAQSRAENPDASVLVRPHGDSSADTLVRILNAAREAGVVDVRILE